MKKLLSFVASCTFILVIMSWVATCNLFMYQIVKIEDILIGYTIITYLIGIILMLLTVITIAKHGIDSGAVIMLAMCLIAPLSVPIFIFNGLNNSINKDEDIKPINTNLTVEKWYWTNDYGHTRCYLSYGYHSSFILLQELFEIAKKDYPNVSEKEFDVIEIVNSNSKKGYKCISFLINDKPNADYKLNQSC